MTAKIGPYDVDQADADRRDRAEALDRRRSNCVDLRRLKEYARPLRSCWFDPTRRGSTRASAHKQPAFWAGPAPEPELEVAVCARCAEALVASSWVLASRARLDAWESIDRDCAGAGHPLDGSVCPCGANHV